MKKIFILSLLTASLAIVSCDKDEDKASLSADSTINATWSASNVVLEQSNATQTALTISWETVTNLGLSPSYYIIFTHGENTKRVSANASPFSMTVKELNSIMTDLKIPTGQATSVKATVVGDLSGLNENAAIYFGSPLTSAEQTLSITSYEDLIEPTEWGIVGDATPNSWDGPDIHFWKTDKDDEYVAYTTLTAGQIKFRKNNDWSENLGGSNGTLSEGGSNITVVAGTYKITLNVKAKTYTIEKYTWGIIGDGANGWGDTDDIPLEYDGATDTWKKENVTLKDGAIKFRLNNAWQTNYGADSSVEPEPAQQGNLSAGGKNIKTTAGTYTITVNFSKTPPTYSITK